MRRVRYTLAALITSASLAILTPSASALSLGFNDVNLQHYAGTNVTAPNLAALNAGLANARRAGATEWRLMLTWTSLTAGSSAPQPATAAADPAWSGYRWMSADRLVKAVTAAGLRPIITFYSAPKWAEGPGRPAADRVAPAGTWRPDPTAVEQFAKAFTTRYSGSYPDPEGQGAPLPKVTYVQPWNEPNLSHYLTPQYVQTGSTFSIASVPLYRQLHQAYARGARSVRKDVKLIMAGTAPFGGFSEQDPRIPPVMFNRLLLCVSETNGKLKGRRNCPKIDLDGRAHHTYPIGPPWRTASNPDDVVVPDMPKLNRVFDAAARAGTVSKKAVADSWMTEMSWESKPDPNGLSLEQHALYLQSSIYILWRDKVKHVIWWNSRDMAPGADWEVSHQSGIFARGADPSQDVAKPSFTAFRFPFVAFRKKGVAQFWSKPPAAGTVIVEALGGGKWKTVRTLKRRGDVATGTLRVGPGTQLRARVAGETSLVWKAF